MSKPWPDELRQMVDALMHGGACPSVYGCSDGGWRIHTGRAWADYDEQGRWWFDGSFRNAAVVLAELLQRSDTIAPAQTRDPRHALQERILAAVPGALVAIWSDGIEVSVGSKSVRWKCEKNGWSLGDDLFASDDRVIEHARAITRMLEDAKERGFKPPQPAGATTMTKALDQAKVDASEAALRTAAKQLAKAARDPLAGAVARHLAPGDDSMRAKVAALLETDAGLAMLKAVLSLALSAIPQAGTRGAAIAHELRVQAMADGADLALDVIAGPLREVVALYLQDPAGAPPAAPALDAPQAKGVEWAAAEQKEGAR